MTGTAGRRRPSARVAVAAHLAGLAALLPACSLGTVSGGGPEGAAGDRPTPDPVTSAGGAELGAFTFDSSAVPGDGGLPVHYVAPAGGGVTDVLIVLHGMERNGAEYRDAWLPLVEGRDVLVLVPEFDEERLPGSTYNLGGMLDEDDDPVPREEWAFPVVEQLFDHAVEEFDLAVTDYLLWGHSAGAQLVHRFVMFHSDNRVETAVAANAGWYTLLDDGEPFPYGLEDGPAKNEDMGPALETDLVVLLGADDVDSEADSLRRDDQSDEQGRNRLERGLHFYRTSREAALEESLPFNWRLMALPGIAHSHEATAAASVPILFDAG